MNVAFYTWMFFGLRNDEVRPTKIQRKPISCAGTRCWMRCWDAQQTRVILRRPRGFAKARLPLANRGVSLPVIHLLIRVAFIAHLLPAASQGLVTADVVTRRVFDGRGAE